MKIPPTREHIEAWMAVCMYQGNYAEIYWHCLFCKYMGEPS